MPADKVINLPKFTRYNVKGLCENVSKVKHTLAFDYFAGCDNYLFAIDLGQRGSTDLVSET